MSYRHRMEEIVRDLKATNEVGRSSIIAALAHWGPQLIDLGAELDGVLSENKRLKIIADLVGVTEERDALKKQVADLKDQLKTGNHQEPH